MLALIYLGLAIALGDFLCRRFYRFVSTAHRWAAAVLVGIVLSTWFTYLAGLALAQIPEALLSADVLFFVFGAGAIFWLSREAPKISAIAQRAPGSSTWDWITLAGLCAAACVLLIGTLYVNKQGQLCLAGAVTRDFAAQLTAAQSVALDHSFPTAFPYHAVQEINRFLFYFQAGNLEFLGLNVAWSVDVLSVLGLTSTLALVMALGELLFHSRVVGRLGATLFFFHGFLERLSNLATSSVDQSWGFWKQIAFVNGRHVPFATGILLLVLIFLVAQYRPKLAAERTNSDLKSFVFTGLLIAAVPPWSAPVLIATAVVLFCLFVAYGCWRLWSLKTPMMLGRALSGLLIACMLVAGIMDSTIIRGGPPMEIKYEDESLVKGLVFRRSVTYKIPDSFGSRVTGGSSPELPVTAFEGGHGNGRAQFNNARAIATDSAGNIFVADGGNGRVQKFSATGAFVTSMQPFEAPSGIAVDRAGNIYVAEIGTKHCVQKLGPNGISIAKWLPGLYGPRKIAIGPDDSIYVVDSGHNRIVKLSSDGQVLASWGSEGSGDGQFRAVSSVTVDPSSNKVFVADPVNSRVQVFDSNGKFLSKWAVPEWREPLGFEDLAIDPQRGRLYASSAHQSTIVVFDLQGNRLGTVMPTPPEKLEAPSALALAKGNLLVLDADSGRVFLIPLWNR